MKFIRYLHRKLGNVSSWSQKYQWHIFLKRGRIFVTHSGEKGYMVMGITCTSQRRVGYLMAKGFKGSSNFKIKWNTFFSCRKISIPNLMTFSPLVTKWTFWRNNPFHASLQGRDDVLTSEKLLFDRNLC